MVSLKLMLPGFALWSALCWGSLAHADDRAEDAVQRLRGVTTRAKSLPGNSVVEADLPSTVTDADLVQLAPLKNLLRLKLSGRNVTDKGIEELVNLKKLMALNLSTTSLTDEGLKSLVLLKDLEYLDLRNTKISGAGLKTLTALKSLATVQFEGNGSLDATDLMTLRSLNTRQRSVEFVKSFGGEVNFHQSVFDKPVERVVLNDAKITDIGLKELAPLKSLEVLSLQNTGITDAGLKELTTLKNLRALNLSGTKVTDASVSALTVFLKLEHLNLRKTKVTDMGVIELRRAFPKCKIFHDSD